jgi:hypothetical protein
MFGLLQYFRASVADLRSFDSPHSLGYNASMGWLFRLLLSLRRAGAEGRDQDTRKGCFSLLPVEINQEEME